jgi:hypothetical protein
MRRCRVIATAKRGDERAVIERPHMMSSGRFFLKEVPYSPHDVAARRRN